MERDPIDTLTVSAGSSGERRVAPLCRAQCGVIGCVQSTLYIMVGALNGNGREHLVIHVAVASLMAVARATDDLCAIILASEFLRDLWTSTVCTDNLLRQESFRIVLLSLVGIG